MYFMKIWQKNVQRHNDFVKMLTRFRVLANKKCHAAAGCSLKA